MGDAVAVFPSAPPAVRTNDVEYHYRQDTDLYFLTGFEEPDCVLVLAPNHAETKSVIFVRPRDREREVWEGRRLGVESAAAALGVDAAYPIGELWEHLPGLLETSDNLYYVFGIDDDFNRRIVEQIKRLRVARRRTDRSAINVLDPSPIVHEMRVIKSAADIAGLRRAADISREGHTAAMRHSRPGMHEYEIEAIIEYAFRSRGSLSPAYGTIVASGPNATVLHFTTSRRRVAEGDLVLIDAGAEYDYYCADITRTWPISGKFSPEQKAIYDIVLAGQQRAIELCRPGKKWNTDVHDACVRVLVEGMLDLGLLKGSAQENIEKETYKEFYMHRTGHFLGMDTHDVGNYRRGGDWRPLEAGMVLTVEPGLYFRDDAEIDARFKGIGVRIEDDVLITETGCENLTEGTPKTVEEIERTIAEGRESREPLFA